MTNLIKHSHNTKTMYNSLKELKKTVRDTGVYI
jgi:hypothetical protein